MDNKLIRAMSILLIAGGVAISAAGSIVELVGVAERDGVVEKYDLNQEYEDFLFKAEAIARNELDAGNITSQDYAETVNELSMMTIDDFVLTKSMVNAEAKKVYKSGKDMSDSGTTAVAAGVFPLAVGAGLLFATDSEESKRKKTGAEILASEEKQLS